MKKCACGCGQFVKEKNRFIWGHTWKNKKRPEISKRMKGKNNPMYGKHPTKETKMKISKNHADNSGKNHYLWNKHPSKKTRQKMSEANSGKNNPMWRKNHSKKTRKLMSKAKMGKNHPFWRKHFSKNYRQKISKALKGRTLSEKHKKKISKNRKGKYMGKNNSFWGEHHTKNTKKQQSIKRIKWFKEHPEGREQSRQHCIEMLKNGFKPSKFEKRIMKLIKQNHLHWKYIGDGRAGSFFGKIPDFINTNGQKAFAEAYDDYWHDEDYVPKRRRFFAKFGFKTKFIHYKDSDEKIIRCLKNE